MVIIVLNLVDSKRLQDTNARLTIFKNWHTGLGMRVTIWAFLKAESTVAFNCQYQCRSLAGLANKHAPYLTYTD